MNVYRYIYQIQRTSPNRAPTSFVSEWGEEKRRQPQRAERVLLLQARFDEGAVVMYFGEPWKSVG